jgi:hypothetical protein
MKQTPELDKVQERMRPGIISRDGFLGDDPRPLADILAADAQRVAALGLTHAAVAARLRALTEAARGGLGAPVKVDDRIEVTLEEARGVLPCPWPHPGVHRKARVCLRRLDTGETLVWTILQIHLVETHGFYEGEGCPYRLSPAALKRILDISEDIA